MELGLKMEEFTCCETVGNVVVSHEESMETSIPEYCPDIARIVDTVGQLRIKEKVLSEGRLNISGNVRVTVLYTSEESAGLKSLVLAVPFSCRSEEPRLQGCRNICVCGRLPLAEAKAITSRKLYVRVMPEFIVEGIACARQQLCCGTEQEDTSLQLRKENIEISVLSSVLEREFNFSQECMPEDGSIPEDLLLDRTFLRVTDCQRIAKKLLIKGNAEIFILYRTEEQSLRTYEVILPFSQILDGEELPEEAVYHADCWVIDSHIRLIRTDGASGFGISLRLGVMVKIYELRETSCLSDLYSTRYEAKIQRQKLTLNEASPDEVIHQNASEQLDLGRDGNFACLTAAECGAVSTEPSGDHASLRTNLRLKILYLDESGAPVSAERVAEITAELPDIPRIVGAICGSGTVQMSGKTCQVQIPVDFSVTRESSHEINGITGVELNDPPEKERPSLVLRRIGKDETLWDVAKTYRTDPALILQANDVQEGDPLPDGMVLIPKVR